MDIMVPSTRLFFWYNFGDMPYLNQNYPIIDLKKPVEVDYNIDDQKFNLNLDSLNIVEGTALTTENIIDSETYEINIKKKPREPYPEFHYTKNIKKFVWTFQISLFKDYKADNEALLKKCFEFDWACCDR